MGLKFQTLKYEMEKALKELGLKVPKDARIGDRANQEMLKYARAYIKAVTKFAYSIADNMTGRTTLKAPEIKLAVGAVKFADIEKELPKEGETTQ